MARKQLLTFEEAEQEYAVHRHQLRKWIADGRLQPYRFQNALKIKRHDLEALLAEGAGDHLAGDDTADDIPLAEGPPAQDEKAEVDDEGTDATLIDGGFFDDAEVTAKDLFGEPFLHEDEETDDAVSNLLDGFIEDTGAGKETREEHREKRQKKPDDRIKKEQSVTSHIRFQCECGKRMKAESRYIGLFVSCPCCKKSVAIPEKSMPRDPKQAIRPGTGQSSNAAKQGMEPVEGQSAPGRNAREHVERDVGPTGDISTGWPQQVQALEAKVNEIARSLEGINAEVAALAKANRQVSFDIARLFDLVGRLGPEASAPLESSAEILRKIKEPRGESSDHVAPGNEPS